MLDARSVVVRYPGADTPAVAGVSVGAVPGKLVAVVGPNGSGKSTLMKALLGSVAVEGGTVELSGRLIGSWPAQLRARRIGFVAQREDYPFAWRVREIVEFGRYPWLGALDAPTSHDHVVVSESMRRADVSELGGRRIDTLSGGEWQRVRIARALAQESQILLLDEPTAALDLGHEMEIFELVRQLVDDGLAAIVVTHQLNLAARYADLMLLLDRGVTVAQGNADAVFEPTLLERVFGWPVEVVRHPDGAPQFVTRRRPRVQP